MDILNVIITILLIISWLWIIMLTKESKRKNLFMKEIMNSSRKRKTIDVNSTLNKNDYIDFQQLINDYNNMIDILEESIYEVEGKNVQLNSILKSVSNGIIVIDINNNIFLMNDRAKKYLKYTDDLPVENRNIKDIINDKKILKYIQQNINIDKCVIKELRLSDGNIYRIKIDPISVEKRKNIMIASIINIEDITERIKLENMRRDFAANVSHELKTPLTSIQGFVETLIENESILTSEKRLRFLGIIEDESKRLEMLINDILLLSSIERDDIIDYEFFDLNSMMEHICNLLSGSAKKRNIDLIVENKILDENGNSFIFLPKFYFEELLINLISNGIKYNINGGHVKVILSESNDKYHIRIVDTGIGINKNDIHRVFERFYRSENAINKGIGGTGLGLAIVKHIVISMGGNIRVDSSENMGSEFFITIPINKSQLNRVR